MAPKVSLEQENVYIPSGVRRQVRWGIFFMLILFGAGGWLLFKEGIFTDISVDISYLLGLFGPKGGA